jgi:hypothetical protein
MTCGGIEVRNTTLASILRRPVIGSAERASTERALMFQLACKMALEGRLEAGRDRAMGQAGRPLLKCKKSAAPAHNRTPQRNLTSGS